jgi:glycosyltransferase involved in cell wall biosynthesis
MKILIGGPYAYKNQIISGGVEGVIKNLKHGINLYEPDINLKIVSGSDKARVKIEIDNDITYIKHPRLKLGSVFLSSYPYRIKDFLKKNNFDVLNDHSIDFSYYGLKMQDRLLLTLHGIAWQEKKYMSKYKQPFWHLLYIKRLEKILKNLRYFISINPYAKQVVEKKTNAMIYDICNPIPDELFKLKNEKNENRMLYIGVISKRKNLFTLIKSLLLVKNEVKDFKLIIAGKINDKEYFDETINYIKKNNLTENIQYLGKITEEQKYQEFSKMSFLVLPSLQETAPLIISEAFATGKPVIASNICGIPYMIEDDKTGFLINPRDEKDIASKIIYLMENSEITHSMGINGRKYAEINHSLKTVVKKYKTVYEEIAAKSS